MREPLQRDCSARERPFSVPGDSRQRGVSVPSTSRLRQSTLSAARKLGILPTLEYARFLKCAGTSFIKNRRFLKQQPPPHYVAPPIWLAYDAYSNLDSENIYAQGKAQA
jgi:hypothetical protein